MGWDSKTYQFRKYNTHYSSTSGARDPFDFDNTTTYGDTTGATWFMRNWWTWDRIAKKFYNDLGLPVKLSSISFLACAGHSGGKQFMTSSGGLRTVAGHGCTFFADVYVKDADGNVVGSKTGMQAGSVQRITSENCSYNGVAGATSTVSKGTKFGSDLFSGAACLSANRRVLDMSSMLDEIPLVPVGGTMMVHAYAENNSAYWTGGDANNSLLVIKFDGSSTKGEEAFQPEIIPEETDYIWIMTEGGWKKERKAFVMTNNGWEKAGD